MNFFDLFVVIVTVGLAVLGFREGLVRGIFKLVGFVALIILMAVFSRYIVYTAIQIDFLGDNILIPLSFLVILIIGTGIIHITAHLLYKLIHLTPIGFIDSGLGCAFGIIKALFLSGLIAILISLAPGESFLKQQYDNSKTADYLIKFISESIPFVKKAAEPYYHRLKPAPQEPEQKQDDKTIPSDFI